MKAIFYTTHCPKCEILEEKLKEKKIKYETITDEKIIVEKGFKTMPNLEIDGKILNYLESVKYLNKL